MNLIGLVLGSRYRIEERLGSGAMGTVYRARHVKIGRTFAIKVLHRELLANTSLVERFEQEALVAGRLEHPNVVHVIDFGEMDDGTRYTVMDLVPGTQLSALMGVPMAAPRVIRIVTQILDGLQHAHDAGLIHRDFKPDNVIIERGDDGSETPRIVDFGIAILHQHAASYEARGRLTTIGVVLGTPEYMAPEQARGEVMDHRADLFAVGITCYEMLTGKLPFEGSGVEVAIENMTHDTPAMGVRAPCVDVDPLLEAFTRKLARKNPKDRPATAGAARALLQLIATDRVAAAIELGLAPRARLATSDQTPDPQRTIPLAVHADPDPQRTIPLAVHADENSRARVPVVVMPVVVAVEALAAARSARHRPARLTWLAGTCVTLVALSALGFAMDSARSPILGAPTSEAIELQFPAVRTPSSHSAVTMSVLPLRQRILPSVRATAPTTSRARAPHVVHRLSGESVAVAPLSDVAVQGAAVETRAVISPRPLPAGSASEPTTAAIDSSAVAVAGLYKQLGMQLAALGRTHGPNAAEDLWIRYRRLRFQDTIATAASRARDSQILLAIQRETARRAH